MIENWNANRVRMAGFIDLAKRYKDFSELTTPMLNEFIEKIVVHKGEGRGKQRHQRSKSRKRSLEELAKLNRAGADLTPEEAERLEAHRNRKKAALQDLKARAETDPEAAAELAQQRAQQSEAVKKSRQKMYADAAAGDPEAQTWYERFLATRRENYHKKKQSEAEATQAS